MTGERWKYYLLDDGRGNPYEIYRLRDDGRSFYEEHQPGSLFLARQTGEWSNDSADIRGLLNASMNGEFDPDEAEISEQQALAYLELWRVVGPWPGRP
jgi:hypothetical protein